MTLAAGGPNPSARAPEKQPARDGLRIDLEGLHKQFGATKALNGVDLTIVDGEIHALLGGNGSGKSTLIKVLAGIVRADEGAITFNGEAHDVHDYRTHHAAESGVRFVHQQGATFPGASVTENLLSPSGDLPATAWGVIDWKRAHRRTREVLARYEIDADPRAPLGKLRPVTQQMIAISRALQSADGRPVRALVLDEPTATLPPAEVGLLHEAVRRYAGQGCAVIYVTHRLEELYDFVDCATVLRDGAVVGRMRGVDISHGRLVDLLTGGKISAEHAESRPAVATPPVRPGAPVTPTVPPRISVSNLHGGPIGGVDLQVQPGEIVGIAGLVGSGRTSLLQMLFGLLPSESGTIRLDDKAVRFQRGRVYKGVAYVPEDRLADAAFTSMSVTENLLAAEPSRHWKHLHLGRRAERRESMALIKNYRIKCQSPAATLGSLSGGNQQKAIIARWLSCRPRVVLLDEPSQGVDIGARAEIHDLIRAAAEQGAAVIVISSDMEELAILCHRAVVLVSGRIGSHIRQDQLSAERLERLSYGETEQEHNDHQER